MFTLSNYYGSPALPRLILRTGLILLIVTAALSVFSVRSYRKSADWSAHTDHVISEIYHLRIAIETAESGQRGYIISRQAEFKDKFMHARESAQASFEQLRLLMSDNPSQTKLLNISQQILREKLDFMDAVTEDLFKDNQKAATIKIQSGRGRLLMSQLHEVLNQLESVEQELAVERDRDSAAALQRATTIVVVSLAVAFTLFFLSNFLLQKEIASRKKIEIDLQEANKKALEASNLKSSFLANMSHEIRTPLNGIIGMSKLLEQTELNEKQIDFVDTIKTSSNSLLALINEILDISKIESGKLQLEDTNFELASLLKSAVSIVDFSAKAKGLQIATDVAPDVPGFLLGDPLRLRQVILNLLNNSIKFSERGTIHLRVTKKSAEDSKVDLLFEVIDQGVGLDPAIRNKLFQNFSQGDESTSRRYGGSGLGLAISKQIVQMMGGEIDVESIKGVGSRFFFNVILKVAKYDGVVQPTFDRLVFKELHGYILIAEDNRVNQKVVLEMVNLLGCRSKIVENGEGAIQALKDEEFNLVLMDGQMPIMDGYQATRLIRDGKAGESNRMVPILATTANAIKGDIEKCLEAGMNDYISKPISYDDLAFKIEKWMTRGKRLIDESAMKRIQQMEQKSGKTILKELVDIFSQDAPAAVAKMRELLVQKDIKGLSQAAHNLKSSSANLGALRLRELAERVERSKTDTTDEQIKLLLDSLEKELKFVLEDLARRL